MPVAPSAGEYDDTIGAVVSETVNLYMLPISPVYALLLVSFTTPDAIVIVYSIPVVSRELVGLMVAAVVEYVT